MEYFKSSAEYLRHLTAQYGYRITIKDYIGFIPKDPDLFNLCDPYLIHCSSFCKYIKFSANLYEACQKNTLRLENKLNSVSTPFVGKCHCGCFELVIPVKYDGTLLASIGVSGFDYNRASTLATIKKVSTENNLCHEELKLNYDASYHSVDLKNIDIETITTQISVFSDLLLLYYKLLSSQGIIIPNRHYSESTNKLYMLSKGIAYIKENFSNKISIEIVSEYCGCSQSHLSHTFRKYMGYSFSSYVTHIRIHKAKELLVCSEKKLVEIAFLCGYSDPNYFSVAFSKFTGYSPSKYRQDYEPRLNGHNKVVSGPNRNPYFSIT